ncbi:hypothetical protein KIN20_033154 [Parelaphostrongylus tenuis]|uniref:Uncharacterized protein n=1 Tax=Parelaphostrongylus tenuis TaxID=148309 RepID=A0AAD5WI68_PARTN|nr:hypothetical protein KIN20_033154 [Parelaphostrongylus tenuis]
MTAYTGLTAQTLSVFITVASAFDCLILVAGSPKIRNKLLEYALQSCVQGRVSHCSEIKSATDGEFSRVAVHDRERVPD